MKIAFLGCGNMGSAILGGMLAANLVSKEDVSVCCKSDASIDRISKEYGVFATKDGNKAVEGADVVILAVKPNVLPNIAGVVEPSINKDALIISVAAGETVSALEDLFGDRQIVRTMPNTPAAVGEAMSAITFNDKVTEENKAFTIKLFESFGQAEVIPESLMDAVIGVSGSSPAYIYMVIEAMADGAVAEGMPREQAYKFAAQSVLGSAKMVLETGIHPGELKDAVCSPGGTTIEGVAVLESRGLRDTIIAGERACVEKSRKMSAK